MSYISDKLKTLGTFISDKINNGAGYISSKVQGLVDKVSDIVENPYISAGLEMTPQGQLLRAGSIIAKQLLGKGKKKEQPENAFGYNITSEYVEPQKGYYER